jgi:hypothetical protein
MTDLLETLEALPETSLTTRLLGALDWIVPGEWNNIVSLERMIRDVTGESDEGLIQQIGERALVLFADPEQGYQRAVQVYQGVDSASTVAGAAALASMASERFEILSFLEGVAPKPDTVQAVDAGAKLAAELVAFALTNGLPGDSVMDFANALAAYGKEERMRMTAWLAFDALIPLGPDFLEKILDTVGTVDLSELQDNRVFRFVSEHLPGDIAQQRDTLRANLESAGGQLKAFAGEREMSQESLVSKVREYVEVADDKLDLLAASLDMTTNVFEHTGVQTVARRIVSRAYGEI